MKPGSLADLARRGARYTPVVSPGKGRWVVTSQEVEEIKGHFDAVTAGLRVELKQLVEDQVGGLRTELRTEIAGSRQELRTEIAGVRQELHAELEESRRHAGVVADDLRSEIRLVADGVALANERIDQLDLKVDGLTGEMRRGFAGVRAEIRSLHAADDELRRRIEAQEKRGA
jgi:hypothetical protein